MAEIRVDSAAVNNLANHMDELSHRARDVLSRYGHAVMDTQPGFDGEAGLTNINTAQEVATAQQHIQERFNEVNDMLRQGAGHYTNSDADNAHHIASVAGGLRFT